MSKTIQPRDDTKPERGEQQYGEVDFADPTNKKYPIDTPAHIRAAWSYINQSDNASNYKPEEVEISKDHIRRAAGKHGIDSSRD